ncbi:hypothetical protein PFLUV_G00007130 [Perca fluviatilis]|uniref:Uncharacterized protein n=1 Tax=Perca fluviatilis TaxID=8168 RepID=A0A6A5FQY2_PERFL|nr:hypothetical protein PFLUV_G00007130 [Perca fluviatilis]
MAENNLLAAAAATLFTDATYTDIADWAGLLNLQLPQKSTYYSIQSSYLIPVIAENYKKQEDTIRARLICQTLDGEEVQICGDGRSDSPGHSCKYTTYSFMDDSTNQIVTFELIQELLRRCKSILHHICGVHRWEEDGMEHKCYHTELPADEQRKKKWLAEDSPAYKVLYEVVPNTRLLKDLEQMALFKHTGLQRHNVVFQKQSKQWIARPVYQETTQTFRNDMMDAVIQRRLDPSVKYQDPETHFKVPRLAANIARVSKPRKEDVISGHASRFTGPDS